MYSERDFDETYGRAGKVYLVDTCLHPCEPPTRTESVGTNLI